VWIVVLIAVGMLGNANAQGGLFGYTGSLGFPGRSLIQIQPATGTYSNVTSFFKLASCSPGVVAYWSFDRNLKNLFGFSVPRSSFLAYNLNTKKPTCLNFEGENPISSDGWGLVNDPKGQRLLAFVSQHGSKKFFGAGPLVIPSSPSKPIGWKPEIFSDDKSPSSLASCYNAFNSGVTAFDGLTQRLFLLCGGNAIVISTASKWSILRTVATPKTLTPFAAVHSVKYNGLVMAARALTGGSVVGIFDPYDAQWKPMVEINSHLDGGTYDESLDLFYLSASEKGLIVTLDLQKKQIRSQITLANKNLVQSIVFAA